MELAHGSFPVRPFFTRGGLHIPHKKNTAGLQSVVMPPPDEVIIPMIQHIGAPCTPVVKKGDGVFVGTLIGDSDKFVSAPIHSSVSGTVTDIRQVMLSNGATGTAVVIESDGNMTPDPGIAPPVINSTEDFLSAVRNSGLVGLGGAGFPAHVKLTVPKGKNIDTLLINCAECEPYITSDHREVLENSWGVMSGIYAVKDILGIKRVIIGVEANKPDAIKELTEIAQNDASDPNDEVRVLKLSASYPQGAEKILIKACTGREVPAGGLPSDAGCIVMNVASVAFLSSYLKTGMPLVRKRITVDGSAVAEPKNVFVPIGTPISKVIEFCGGYSQPVSKLLYGGPMMGTALSDDTFVVLKQNNAVLAFGEKEARLYEPTECIRCGKCMLVCPMKLSAVRLNAAVKKQDAAELESLSVMTCMECGCCAYVCPAHKHLVQTIRLGKGIVRAEAAKKKGDGAK